MGMSALRLQIYSLTSFNAFHEKRMLRPDSNGVREIVGDICWIVENWEKLNGMLTREYAARAAETEAAWNSEFGINTESGISVPVPSLQTGLS